MRWCIEIVRKCYGDDSMSEKNVAEILPLRDEVVKCIITDDEIWYKGDSKLKRPRHSIKNQSDVMLIVFFDYHGVVHKQFLPTGQTVDKEYHLSFQWHLHKSIHKKTSKFIMNQFLIFASW